MPRKEVSKGKRSIKEQQDTKVEQETKEEQQEAVGDQPAEGSEPTSISPQTINPPGQAEDKQGQDRKASSKSEITAADEAQAPSTAPDWQQYGFQWMLVVLLLAILVAGAAAWWQSQPPALSEAHEAALHAQLEQERLLDQALLGE
mmetsp:Transcript_13801/g.24154  ORF Transcript_13801/g.24154 Transcript_13801/m.24154 type:complete len:146 (-) Transcript_13801:474-911(-)|eukprot:CAMPEP_0119104992 /NCGR_PEP_ID=MMETSP1180-20130426/3073_1 /TAXON_ID=3052 ORGANISM="Chlamydomonas cf sp, Strain CCMP681" /NCGR_SAMPLE_ID=MMETSP1180 /ASSEMBLY_ACC=CAM_ASM_000741 /LENGTH=145 /DNA_ID=CAMNT_0007089913 /DNA_START=81 /DNA_END=518 /DNA_ORIENTATION=-